MHIIIISMGPRAWATYSLAEALNFLRFWKDTQTTMRIFPVYDLLDDNNIDLTYAGLQNINGF